MRFRVFRDINARIPFENYIETGTYLGVTTHFLANTALLRGASVYSCDINDDYFKIASRTVGDIDNVHPFTRAIASTFFDRCRQKFQVQ